MNKFKLWTPEGGLVTEIELPLFKDNPEVLIWGARVFLFVDLYMFMDSTCEDSFNPEAFKEIETDEGCYVEVFAYHIPPRADELPPLHPRYGVEDRRIPVPDHHVNRRLIDLLESTSTYAGAGEPPPLCPECKIRGGHQILCGLSNESAKREGPLNDRLYVDPAKVTPENVPEGCLCHIAPGYHWVKCPVATWGLLNGHARNVYFSRNVYKEPEPMSSIASIHESGVLEVATPEPEETPGIRTITMRGEPFNCSYCNRPETFKGIEIHPQEYGETFCSHSCKEHYTF